MGAQSQCSYMRLGPPGGHLGTPKELLGAPCIFDRYGQKFHRKNKILDLVIKAGDWACLIEPEQT